MTPGFNLYSRHSANIPYILLPVPEAPNSGKHHVYPLDTWEHIDLARKVLGESGRLYTRVNEMPLMTFVPAYKAGDPVEGHFWSTPSGSNQFYYRRLAFQWVPTVYEVWLVTEYGGCTVISTAVYYDDREANMAVLEGAHKNTTHRFTIEKSYRYLDPR